MPLRIPLRVFIGVWRSFKTLRVPLKAYCLRALLRVPLRVPFEGLR